MNKEVAGMFNIQRSIINFQIKEKRDVLKIYATTKRLFSLLKHGKSVDLACHAELVSASPYLIMLLS